MSCLRFKEGGSPRTSLQIETLSMRLWRTREATSSRIKEPMPAQEMHLIAGGLFLLNLLAPALGVVT